MRSRFRPVLLLAVAALAAAAVPILVTWPAPLHLSEGVATLFGDPDLQCGLWWPKAFAHSVVTGAPIFQRPELNWPEGQDTRMLLWNYGAELFFAPIALLASPIATLNLIALGSMMVNGLAAAWLGRVLTRNRAGVAAALVLGSADAYTWFEGSGGRVEQALWAPLALYAGALVLLHRKPGDRKALLIGAASLAWAGGIYWFYAYFAVVMTVAVVLVMAVQQRLTRSNLRDLAVLGVGSIALALPFLLPIANALITRFGQFHAASQEAGTFWFLQARGSLSLGLALLGGFGPASQRWVHVPVVYVVLAAWAAWKGKGAVRALAWVGLTSTLFAMGPVLCLEPSIPVAIRGRAIPMPMAVLDLLPGFTRFWWPYRWQGVTVVAAAACAAWAVSTTRRPALTALAVGGLCVLNSIAQLHDGFRDDRPLLHPIEVPPALKAIAEMGGTRPIVQVPIGHVVNGQVGLIAFHHQPIDSGLNWNLASVRTPGWEARRRSVPLLQKLDTISIFGKRLPRKQSWTLEEAGGFHYVMAPATFGTPPSFNLVEGVTSLLGEPFYQSRMLVIWAVPGIGEPPPGYATETPTEPRAE